MKTHFWYLLWTYAPCFSDNIIFPCWDLSTSSVPHKDFDIFIHILTDMYILIYTRSLINYEFVERVSFSETRGIVLSHHLITKRRYKIANSRNPTQNFWGLVQCPAHQAAQKAHCQAPGAECTEKQEKP